MTHLSFLLRPADRQKRDKLLAQILELESRQAEIFRETDEREEPLPTILEITEMVELDLVLAEYRKRLSALLETDNDNLQTKA